MISIIWDYIFHENGVHMYKIQYKMDDILCRKTCHSHNLQKDILGIRGIAFQLMESEKVFVKG